MTLIKTSLLSLIATVFKVSYGLVLNKLLAVYVGPSGVALVGQFQNIQAGMLAVATAGFGQGLTKYLAEYRDNRKKSAAVFATALKLVSLLLLPISLGLFIMSNEVSAWLLHSPEYNIWIKGLALGLIPGSVGALFLASLNGLGEIRSLTLVGVLSSCLGIAISLLLVPVLGGSGVIIVLLSTPVTVFLLSAFYLRKNDGFSWVWLKEKVHHSDAKNLGKFTLMALASAVTIPVSHVFIRNYLSDTVSLDAAGIWTGMWRVSDAYLLVITMTLTVYYLPKLSSLKTKVLLKQEIWKGQKIILPLVVFGAIIIFFLKDWIILLLFTDEFIEMKELFAFQLFGDVMKIAAFLYGHVFIAKAQVKVFIFIEFFFSILFVLLVMYFVSRYGLVGVSYAFALNYSVCFLFVYWWFSRSCNYGIFDEDPLE